MQTRYAYDPYGRRTKVTGSVDADFGFRGHYYHQPSGLHLALYRAYDAALRRAGREQRRHQTLLSSGDADWFDQLLHSRSSGLDSRAGERFGRGGEARVSFGNQLPAGPQFATIVSRFEPSVEPPRCRDPAAAGLATCARGIDAGRSGGSRAGISDPGYSQ